MSYIMAQLKINPDTYIGDTGKQLKNLANKGIVATVLWSTPSDYNQSLMKTRVGDVCELSDSIRNYDFICIRIATRAWTWNSAYVTIPTGSIDTGTNSHVRFSVPYAVYQDTAVQVMELGFTDPRTLQIYLNSYPNVTSTSNGGFIHNICGYKFN